MSDPSLEVSAIVAANAAAEPGDVIIVAALPGSGKTTMLQNLAKSATEMTTYLMFNKAPCDDFRAFLTSHSLEHVHASTFHKLAWDALTESGAVLKTMDNPPPELVSRATSAGVSSVVELMELDPTVARMWYDKAVAGEWSVTSDVVLHWLAHATALPELLETPTFKRLRASRRVYCDEAQDASASMVKILQGCTAASVVLAGDSNQAINGFMGSVDPIGNHAAYFPKAKTYPLSQTWRFHSQIAAAFNKITAERCIGRPGRPDADTGDVIVLCATNKEVDAAITQLRALKIKAYKRGSGEPMEGVQVSTVHKAKGGGWHTVVVMRMRRNNVKMAATAVSRARECLYVHWSLVKEYDVKTSSHVRRFGDLKEIPL